MTPCVPCRPLLHMRSIAIALAALVASSADAFLAPRPRHSHLQPRSSRRHLSQRGAATMMGVELKGSGVDWLGKERVAVCGAGGKLG